MHKIIFFGLLFFTSYSINAMEELTKAENEIKKINRKLAHEFTKDYPFRKNLDFSSSESFKASVQTYANAFYATHEEDIRNNVLVYFTEKSEEDAHDYIHENLKPEIIQHIKLMTAQLYLKEHPDDAPDFIHKIVNHK